MIQKEFEHSLRISSKISSFDDVQKALQEVEEALNNLTTSVSNKAETEISDEEGKTGDIQITQNKDKSYTFEIRTEEGWKTPVIGDSAVKFKSKPAFKEQDKSIDEIETNDTTTGDKLAKQTIYDEKADKFIMARADYDSGWQTWDLSEHNQSGEEPLKIEHGLGVLPTMIIGYFAPGQAADAVTFFTPIKNGRGSSYNHGIGLFVDDTRVYFYGGTNSSLAGITVPPTTSSDCNGVLSLDGSIRVLIWK